MLFACDSSFKSSQKRPIRVFRSYQRFANCYRDFYRLQPELTRSIYDQFVSQLQASIKEEIQEVKEEGNLEALFDSLDKIVEEAKDQEEPAWRPSGIPEEDVRSAMVPYLLKHRAYLRKVLKEKEEENRKLAESVLAGRDRIAELQRLIQDRKRAWQAISKEQRELVMTFKEPHCQSCQGQQVPYLSRQLSSSCPAQRFGC
nr:PREDICTED: polyamine-modulated factor 1-like [Apteryx mantelli mantelli]